jgi:hypothetical protein
MGELVTIGVPVWQGWAFVAETLGSIAAQTHRELAVLISVDGGDERSADACRPFLADSRFRMVVQPKRLGWVDNQSWLMAEARGDFWCYQAHDDLVVPDYLETLLAHLRRHPEAAVAYGDVRAFGMGDYLLVQPSVTGTPFARQLHLLADHFVGGAYRGVARIAALRAASPLRHNRCNDFSVDQVWMAAAARVGELHRVPRELYRARYRPQSAHQEWLGWDAAARADAWMVHCQQMLEEAWRVPADADQRRLLWAAAVARLLAPHRFPLVFSPIASFPRERRAAILDAFVAATAAGGQVDVPACFDRPWAEVAALTRALCGLEDRPRAWRGWLPRRR